MIQRIRLYSVTKQTMPHSMWPTLLRISAKKLRISKDDPNVSIYNVVSRKNFPRI